MNLGMPEMIFIFLLALIIFGPKKLPEIGRQIGRALNEFKRASNEFRSQIESEINKLEVEDRRTILPPAEPVKGTLTAQPSSLQSAPIPASSAGAAQETAPQPNLLAKAPDA
jgi:TatA/E family protein of Tat protein translocase